MADDPKPPADLFSRTEDGTKTDRWIMDELLDADDLDEGEFAHVVWPPDEDDEVQTLTYREKLAYLLKGNENSGNYEHQGRPGEVGGSAPSKGGSQVDLRPATPDDATRIKALKLPPAWTDVQLSDDPHADLQATGKDAKGRTQYRYSAAHSERAAAEKFDRLKEFNEALPALRERLASDLSDTALAPKDREAALVLHLIDKTGFRIGSDADTGADKQAYGASTLKAGHVQVKEDKISFRFTGKKGVPITKTIADPLLAKELAARKAAAGRGPLFDTSDAAVRDYLHTRVGDGFKVKDFRTWHGTNKALETIAKMPVPKSEAAFKKAKREVATVVAKHLGNTPAVALASYINPAVFAKWKVK